MRKFNIFSAYVKFAKITNMTQTFCFSSTLEWCIKKIRILCRFQNCWNGLKVKFQKSNRLKSEQIWSFLGFCRLYDAFCLYLVWEHYFKPFSKNLESVIKFLVFWYLILKFQFFLNVQSYCYFLQILNAYDQKCIYLSTSVWKLHALMCSL